MTACPVAHYLTVSDPAQVREVLRRADEFAPHNALIAVTPLQPEALRVLSRVGFALPEVLASATGERHRRVRRLVTARLRPGTVARVEPRVRELTAERCALLRDAPSGEPVELVRDLVRHVPPVVMGKLLGSGVPDPDDLSRWSRDSLELFWGWPDPARQVELASSAAELYRWLRDDVEAHRDDDSLYAVLRRAGLDRREICSLGYFLLIAGQETTAQLITIALVRALQQPELWQHLASGGSATDLVRTVLAAESSVPTWRRVAATDTRLAGRDVPAGTELLLELTGHHDEEASGTAYGLAFGHGVHRCPGAGLAELETVAVVEETARALPGLRLVDADPPWRHLLSFRAPAALLAEVRR